MGRSEILFNYRQAISQAEKLEDTARRIDRLADDWMGETISSLKAAWQSDSSPQFYSKMSQVQSDIRTHAENIRKVADSIRETAEEIKRAELRALEIAKRRDYD